MCGIIGATFQQPHLFTDKDVTATRAMITDMLVAAEARGAAATGLLVINKSDGGLEVNKPTAYMLKAPVKASEFVTTKEFDDILRKVGMKTYSVLGHTRAATDGGAENNKNNHPHYTGNFIGVHNGIVDNAAIYKKFPSLKAKSYSNCDSEAIFALINHYSNTYGSTTPSSEISANSQKPILNALSQIDGWFAVAFADLRRPDRVYLARDLQTPLEIAFNTELEAAFFASNYNYILGAHKNRDKETNLKRVVLGDNKLAILSCSYTAHNSISAQYFPIPVDAAGTFRQQNTKTYAVTQGG